MWIENYPLRYRGPPSSKNNKKKKPALLAKRPRNIHSGRPASRSSFSLYRMTMTIERE
jgi:hypothetical protein